MQAVRPRTLEKRRKMLVYSSWKRVADQIVIPNATTKNSMPHQTRNPR